MINHYGAHSTKIGAQCDASAPHQSLFHSPKKRNWNWKKNNNKAIVFAELFP